MSGATKRHKSQHRHGGLYKVLTIVAILFLLWFLSRAIIGAIVPPVPEHPVQERQMTVIAHQGGKSVSPENTLPAFRRALDRGADTLEMDVHLTRDGHLVVLHDDSVDRTTNGTGAVIDLTLAEIKTLDAAYWWPESSQESDGEFPYRGQGITIPTLAEVLSAFPNTLKVIEIKPNSLESVTALGNILRRHNQANLVVVASFHIENLKAFREGYPEFSTSAGQPEIVRFFILNHLGFAGSYFANAQFFQVPVQFGPLRVITRAFIRNAQKNNILVQVWTINDEDEMRTLLDMGVDGIITDSPSRLAKVLNQ